MDRVLIGAVAALVAGGLFAAGGVVQQRAASRRPPSESLSPKLIVGLARDRQWLAGVGLGVLSYVFQALALALAPLAVVQPLLASEVLFAIPISARLHGSRLGRQEWAGVLAVSGGLAASIVAADPSPGDPLISPVRWAPALGGVALTAAAALWSGRRISGPSRASAYALAAALVMSVESALMAATTRRFEAGVVVAFTSWEPYAMAVASLTGLLLIQSAFEAGPLAASMPVADAVEPLAAIAIGLGLFGETVAGSPIRLGIAACGLFGLLAGIIALDTSSVVQSWHREEQRDHVPARDRVPD